MTNVNDDNDERPPVPYNGNRVPENSGNPIGCMQGPVCEADLESGGECEGDNLPEEEQLTDAKRRVTRRMRRFVIEYVADLDAKAAAIRAGYAAAGAHVRGCRLLKRPEIQALIDEHEQDRLAAANITADRVIRELAKLAFADGEELERMAPHNKIGAQAKLSDKGKALEILAKRFGLLTERVEQVGGGNAVIVMMPSNGREEKTE